MKKIISLIIILLVIPFFCLAEDFVNLKMSKNEEQPLRLTVTSNKESYLVGDKIKIICRVFTKIWRGLAFFIFPAHKGLENGKENTAINGNATVFSYFIRFDTSQCIFGEC